MADVQAENRLRDAFAQLLLQGNNQAVPVDAVWAAQGPRQFPKPAAPDLPIDRPELSHDRNTTLPIVRGLEDPHLDFPTAAAGPQSPDRALGTLNQMDRRRPFPDAKNVEVVGPYKLPKSPDTKRRK